MRGFFVWALVLLFGAVTTLAPGKAQAQTYATEAQAVAACLAKITPLSDTYNAHNCAGPFVSGGGVKYYEGMACVVRSSGAWSAAGDDKVYSTFPSHGSCSSSWDFYFTTSCEFGYDYVNQRCNDPPCSVNDPPLGATTLIVPPSDDPKLPNQYAPSTACSDGCQYSGSINDATVFSIDGERYITYSAMQPSGQQCTVGGSSDGTPGYPPPDADGDGYSDGNDGFPTDPGEHADSDGDGMGDSGDFMPSDPSNGADGSQPPPPDTNGDGQPDYSGPGNEADNVSVGGGNCSTPPQSTGDGILSQIAYQTWATRCAIEGQGKAGSGTDGGEGSAGQGQGVTAGELYTGTGKTVGTVYETFKAAAMASPLVSSADGFFSGCESLTGACPVASWVAPEFGVSFDLSGLCADPLASILAMAGLVMLAVASMYAFKVALL